MKAAKSLRHQKSTQASNGKARTAGVVVRDGGAFAHDIAELAGRRETGLAVLAGILDGCLDVQRGAAHRSPCEAHDNTGGCMVVDSVADKRRITQKVLQVVRRDLRKPSSTSQISQEIKNCADLETWRHLAFELFQRSFAIEFLDLLLQVAHSCLAAVALDELRNFQAHHH